MTLSTGLKNLRAVRLYERLGFRNVSQSGTHFEMESHPDVKRRRTGKQKLDKIQSMKTHYLEIVTPDVDAVCATYAAANNLSFSDPVAVLGNARTAALAGGGKVGVRAPMHETEEPVVRPYWLVDDIDAAIAAATAAGAEIAHPRMEIPGHGTFAIYIQGGIHHGLWQR